MCPNVHKEKIMENSYNELSLLSLSKAASILKIGRDSLAKLINTGKLGVVMINQRYKIAYKELERFINDNTAYQCTVTDPVLFTNESNISASREMLTFNSEELFNKLKGELLNG